MRKGFLRGGPFSLFLVASSFASSFLAFSPDARAQTIPKPLSIEGSSGDWKLTLGGWVDGYFGYNFNDPANGKDALRDFDFRHDSFALEAVALDVGFEERGGVFDGSGIVRLTLQAGDEPDAYYASSGSERAADAQPNFDSFRHVQQAYGGYRVAVPWPEDDSSLEFDLGIFMSHIGYEGLNTKDIIFFSHSLLHELTPFYATGVRAIYILSPSLTAQINVTNGWDSVIDNNRSKSVGAQVVWTPTEKVTATLNYLGGPEQDATAAMRNLVDGIVVVKPIDELTLAANGHVGFDRVAPGTALDGLPAARETNVAWYGVAGYARYQLNQVWGLGVRGEVFRDEKGVPWETGFAGTVGEGTAMVESRPQEHLIVRFELRHDQASTSIYATHTPPHVSRGQDTLTLGMIAFF